MRRHGLKDAARYFGFARSRPRVCSGAEIWPTYQTDPERIRRYAAGRRGRGRRPLAAACCPPRSSWRGAAAQLRAHRGRRRAGIAVGAAARARLPARRPCDRRARRHACRGRPRSRAPTCACAVWSARACARRSRHSCRASSRRTSIRAAHDELGVLPRPCCALLPGRQWRASAGSTELRLPGRPRSAVRSGRRRRSVGSCTRGTSGGSKRTCVSSRLPGRRSRRRAGLFATPPDWDESTRAAHCRGARARTCRRGCALEFSGHYQALYARAPHSAIMLGHDGSVTLVGSTFRAGAAGTLRRSVHAARRAAASCRRRARRAPMFLDTVHLVRTAQLPLEDLACRSRCTNRRRSIGAAGRTRSRTRSCSRPACGLARRAADSLLPLAGRRAAPAAGRDTISPAEADTEYYVQRLVSLYGQQFAQAYSRTDFQRMFRLPAGSGPFAAPSREAGRRSIRCTTC